MVLPVRLERLPRLLCGGGLFVVSDLLLQGTPVRCFVESWKTAARIIALVHHVIGVVEGLLRDTNRGIGFALGLEADPAKLLAPNAKQFALSWAASSALDATSSAFKPSTDCRSLLISLKTRSNSSSNLLRGATEFVRA